MNITELKELAEKATPGPWKNVDGIVLVHWDTHPYATWLANFAVGGESMEKKLANSAFCAAANPAEILELIAQLEDAQGEIRALRHTEAGLMDRLAAVEADRAHRVPDVEDLKDRLVAISSAVADSDDREAQAIIRTTLELLASTPAPAQQEPSEPRTEWDDHRVQIVYELLCADDSPPNRDEHWEGYRARQIVDALFQHQEPPQLERKPMTDEQDRALCEAFCNAASDEYFKARPQLDSDVSRRIFYAGHRKAWLEWQTAHEIKE